MPNAGFHVSPYNNDILKPILDLGFMYGSGHSLTVKEYTCMYTRVSL